MAERDNGGTAKRRRERRLHALAPRAAHAACGPGWPQWSTTRNGAPRRQTTEERETCSAPRRQEPPLPAVTRGTQLRWTMRAGDGGAAGSVASAAAGTGSAAHRGAHHRRLALRADPRCACAADGGPAVGGLQAHAICCPRACYRSVQDSIQQRLVDRDRRHSQMAELLMEMKEFEKFAAFFPAACIVQITDIPVPRGHGGSGGGGGGGLQGFLTEQNSTASVAEHIVDIPQWRSSTFSPRPGFHSFILNFSHCG